MDQLNTKGRRAGWSVLALVAALGLALIATAATASARDRNHDKIPDRWEKRHRLSLQLNQANRDQDSDEMPNLGEFQAGTDPRDEDSDGDGTPDGEELAGEVASFTPGTEEGTGVLVISLYAGGELAGAVDEDTRIVCPPAEDEAVDDDVSASARHGGPGPSGPPPAGETTGDDGPSGEPGLNQGPSANEGPGGHHDGCHGTPCTTDELVPGATVHEAEVRINANGSTFKLVALGS